MEIKKNLKKCSFPKIVFQFDTDEEVLEFLENWENKDKAVFSINNQRTEFMQKIHDKVKNAIGSIDCYAEMIPIAKIKTDEQRFQNRTNAFSELSADSVAQNYDPNKFDPIVIWNDPENKKDYVLSGHSRFEGMKRRKEPSIPARYFEGTEAQAIQFARIDANRSANVENLIEDLKAYKLMRDGSVAKKIKPATQTAIKNAFKGTHAKLEAYSFLNPEGYFIQALQTENKSAFPYIETKALWLGELRKQYGEEFTNTFEDDAYNFIYNSSEIGLRMKKEDFFKDIEKRITIADERLYPECDKDVCNKMDDIKLRGKNAEGYKEIESLQRSIDTIKERLKTEKPATRIYTQPERVRVTDVLETMTERKTKLKKDLGVVEKQEASLFGISGDDYDFEGFGFEVKDLDFTEVLQTLLKLNITKKQVVEVLNNKRTYTYGRDGELDFVGFTEKSKFLCIFVDCNERKPKVLSVEIGTEKQIFIYCHGQEN